MTASLFAGSALAADMPARMPVKAVPYAAAYNWTGAYIGLNAGYGWDRSGDALGILGNVNGFVGGGQIGYNWQPVGSPLVVGIEGDFQGTSMNTTSTLGAVTVQERDRWFGTIRGRIGYAWDRFMVYGTGGFAFVNTNFNTTVAGVNVSDSGTKSGYALGAGLEYALTGPWTIGAEYLYVSTGSRSVVNAAATDSDSVRINLVRAKLNYRF